MLKIFSLLLFVSAPLISSILTPIILILHHMGRLDSVLTWIEAAPSASMWIGLGVWGGTAIALGMLLLLAFVGLGEFGKHIF